jgi:hypothetical protein
VSARAAPANCRRLTAVGKSPRCGPGSAIPCPERAGELLRGSGGRDPKTSRVVDEIHVWLPPIELRLGFAAGLVPVDAGRLGHVRMLWAQLLKITTVTLSRSRAIVQRDGWCTEPSHRPRV